MSVVNQVLTELNDPVQAPTLDTQHELDFLYASKQSSGFSTEFWIISLTLILSVSGMLAYWHQSEFFNPWSKPFVLGKPSVASNTSALQIPQESIQSLEVKPVAPEVVKTYEEPRKQQSKSQSTVEPSVSIPSDHNEPISEKEFLTSNQVAVEEADVQPLEPAKADLVAKNITREPSQAEPVHIEKPIPQLLTRNEDASIQLKTPKYQELYEAASEAYRRGDITKANEYIDLAIYEKPLLDFHLLKLRLLLLQAPNKIIPYIYEYKLTITQSIELLAIYAQASQNLGQHENAQWAYKELIKREPANVAWFLGLALSLEHLGKVELALKTYYQAIGLSQDEKLKAFAQSRADTLRALL